MSDDGELIKCAEAVAIELMGQPNIALSTKGKELRFGKKGSISVDLAKGTYFDHSDDTGGGVIYMVGIYKGFTASESTKWLIERGYIKGREREPQQVIDVPGGFPDWMEPKPIAVFEYFDAKGNLAYQVLKFPKDYKAKDGQHKETQRRYMQRRPHAKGGWVWGLSDGLYGHSKDGKEWFKAKAGKDYAETEVIGDAPRFLYRRKETLAAVKAGNTIVLVEGEKDVETLLAWGIPATTNVGGAGYWRPEFNVELAGADVIICSDNDDNGRNRTIRIGAELRATAKRVRHLDLALHWPDMPEKNDVSDWRDKAGGTKEAFLALAEAAPLWKPERLKSHFKAFEFSDLDQPGVELDYVIDDFFTERGVSVIAGASGSGKSFLALHGAMCVSRGLDFFDRPVKHGAVVYQAGEGGLGIKKRMRAYRKHFDIPSNEVIPILVLPTRVNLYSSEIGDTAKIIDEVKAWLVTVNQPLRMFFIDTFSTASAGIDENSGKDVGIVLENVAKIEEALKCNVCIVHHMNADKSKLRGHTSMQANVDQVITIALDETTKIRTAKLTKQKDDEDGITFRFELASVRLDYDARRNKDITSCVVLPVGEKDRLKKEQEKQGFSPSTTERRILMTLFSAIERHGYLVSSAMDGPSDAVGKSIVEWTYYLDIAVDSMVEVEDKKKARDTITKQFTRGSDFLKKSGVIATGRFQGGADSKAQGYVWWTGKPVRGFHHTFPVKDMFSKQDAPQYQIPDYGLNDVDFQF